MKNNYIQTLQSKNKSNEIRLKEIQDELNHFICFLNTEKFIGVESDGERKDWISTSDVIINLQNIRRLCSE